MALNRQEIDLVVNAISKGFDKVADDIKKTGKAADTAGDDAKKSGLKWTELKSGLDLAIGGFRQVAEVAQAAYQGLREGADLNLAAAQFDNLTASIGTTSDALINELERATNGMQSRAELIAGATDIINLGLANTQEETVRLATAVSTLGLDMQQVILTFANNSEARLDALGLSVEGVTEKVAELEAQGFQGDAFDEAVLIGLEEKMRLLGDASETTAGQLQMLEADWANLTNSWKQGAAAALGPIISTLVENTQAQEALDKAYRNGLITWGEWNRASNMVRNASTDNAEVLRELGLSLEGTSVELADYGATTRQTTDEIVSMAIAQKEANEAAAAMELGQQMLEDYGAASRLTSDEIIALAIAEKEAADSTELLGGGLADAAAAGEPVVSLTERLNAQLERLGNSHDWTLNLSVRGIEGVQQAIRAAAGFNANDQPDPFTGLPGQAVGGNPGDAFDPNLGNVAPGGGVVVNNTFNNNDSPAAVANQVAEQIGGAR